MRDFSTALELTSAGILIGSGFRKRVSRNQFTSPGVFLETPDSTHSWHRRHPPPRTSPVHLPASVGRWSFTQGASHQVGFRFTFKPERCSGQSSARALAAGVTGALGTVAFDTHAGGGTTGEATTMAIIDDVNQRNAHLGIVFGFATVAQLLILAAARRVAVERKGPESIAARVARGGVTAAAGALSLGYGWKGALGLYHPDGNEANAYDQMGLYMYYMLNDFGSWIGWVSVSVAAGAGAWMGLEERSIPLWIGIFSIVPIIPAWGMTIATGLPGLPAISTILEDRRLRRVGVQQGRDPRNVSRRRRRRPHCT